MASIRTISQILVITRRIPRRRPQVVPKVNTNITSIRAAAATVAAWDFCRRRQLASGRGATTLATWRQARERTQPRMAPRKACVRPQAFRDVETQVRLLLNISHLFPGIAAASARGGMRFYGSVILWREQTTTTGESELRIGAAEKQHSAKAAQRRTDGGL